jgi:hypothetical protein
VLEFIGENYTYSLLLQQSNNSAVFGIFMMMAGASVFVSMLLIQAVAIYRPEAEPPQHPRRHP